MSLLCCKNTIKNEDGEIYSANHPFFSAKTNRRTFANEKPYDL